MICLNDGQQMIAVSANNQLLLFFNRSSAMPYNYDFIGYHVSIDKSGTKIFTRQGSLLDTLKPTDSSIFDTLMKDNYVIYLSDEAEGGTICIDPQL